ncbi:ATP-NAD kinase family protein [Microbacterium sp. Root180]|uniref:ATP-NAD kinase family protein n=1 Tax=Microbacterium sp. Root180 TaxID=1736483 RepID=UPI0009EAC0EE|nr:NAD(+)/NADH kinase [Microbacterium sp. Root180]
MLGLVVNPIAGIGGPAGLAGSDGADVQALAQERGGAARASARAALALEAVPPGTAVLTAAGAMGADAAGAAGLDPTVVYSPASSAAAGPDAPPSTPADTTAAVRALVEAGATLVLFAGGDGTARDVAAGLDGASELAALGIPAGVKMYSPVFAVSPRAAGAVAAAWVDGGLPLQEREVLDVDEAALRRARVEPVLYATMRVPYRAGRTQARKSATPATEHAAVVAAARAAASALRPGVRYLLGPGGTMSEVARAIGIDKTPLGVDVVLDGRIVRRGASERELLDEIGRGPAKAVVSVIGGQGFLLGRGNQQLSPRVLRGLGPDPLVVVAPESKLIELQGRPLLVDTGDAVADAAIDGFVRVITGPAASSFYPVHAPELTEEPHAS